MATFGYAEMRDWAEQSDDPRVKSMWQRLSNCRSKIAKWCQAAEYAELRTKNLAAENAALRAEVERLREERRWRSTKTEPPSDDQWQVLIYDGRNVDIGSKLDGIGWTHEFGTLEWEAVTHWMPLPAPPAKEEER